MQNGYFPYGNDLRRPGGWLGHRDTKSRYWHATYIGGWPLGALFNGHTILLFGTESLTAGVATLYTFGAQASISPGRIVRWITGRSRDWQGGQRAQESAEMASDLNGRREQISDILEINSGIDIFNICQENGTLITCDTPMSLNDLAGSGGAIGGGEIEIVGRASVYYITAERSPEVYFGDQQVYNIGGGFVGASASLAGGVWSVRVGFNAAMSFDPDNDRPLEVYRDGQSRTVLEEFGSMSDINLESKPFYRFYRSPRYIRELPGLWSSVSENIIQLGEQYSQSERMRYGG